MGDADVGLVGEKDFPEEELTHLDGHKGSKPVRFVTSRIASLALRHVSDCVCRDL